MVSTPLFRDIWGSTLKVVKSGMFSLLEFAGALPSSSDFPELPESRGGPLSAPELPSAPPSSPEFSELQQFPELPESLGGFLSFLNLIS